MLPLPLFNSVMDIAKRFLDKRRREDGAQWGALEIAPVKEEDIVVFEWGGKIPLFEIPFTDLVTRQPSGYVLISTSTDLPPFLEYMNSGSPLSQQLQKNAAPFLARAGVHVAPTRYIYITSTEIYAEIPATSTTPTFFLNVPGMFVVQESQLRGVSMDPAKIFNSAVVKGQWHVLTPGQPGDLPEVILKEAAPVYYQQNCDSYAVAAECAISIDAARSNFCAPRAISGCVAVGWAMLLSSWKRSGWWDSAKIWPGSSCWDRHWPSGNGDFNVSQCADVERTIWRLHTLLGTTPDGATSGDHTLNGAAIFGEFGMGWHYAQATGQPFEFAASIVAKGQPFLWTANGIWNDKASPLISSGVPGGVGHGILAYGYKKSDRTLLVGLGWGSYFGSKYINYDQYASPACFYLTGGVGLSLEASLDSGVEIPLDLTTLGRTLVGPD